MASTSVSSIQRSFKYDVFLSFRGEDTPNNFVGHLYEALKQKGIVTYKDDERIKKGERIDNQLLESIDESRFCIIVFSKNYATSSWCLDELVKIMECQKTTEQTAYPVFYDVEPTEIRHQSGSVGEAFCKHEKNESAWKWIKALIKAFLQNGSVGEALSEHEENEAAGKWRKALKEAADLAGWELKATANGDESKLIQKVVADIFIKLISIKSSVDGNLVGMATRVEEVLSSLEIGTEDVRLIGIKGMGGGGKTTLAATLFNQISNHFEGTSFVDNVREKTSSSGLAKLQEQILKDVLGEQNITINSVYVGKNTMIQMMHRKKALIVLDDVDNIDQLEALAGDPNWFNLGSRIIITTRDEQVLKSHHVKFIHEVNLLSHEEGICLLSKHAFGRESPTTGYEELAKEVVHYASGLPLTIKVLGSSLYGNDEHYWKDTLKRLETIPFRATMDILELSYNCLEDDYKELFLDVACILKGFEKDRAIIALESRGFYAINGLRILEQKCLITVSKDEKLGMHDHLEEMGRNIVQRLHPNSRLGIREEIKDILTNDMGTEATKCISLKKYDEDDLEVLIKGLRNMKELRLLYLMEDLNLKGMTFLAYLESEGSGPEDFSLYSESEVSLYLPDSLQYLEWLWYPYRSLPKTFQSNNLVGLVMTWSKMVQLWEDGEEKVLNKLRFIQFEWSILRTLDLRLAPNLEKLRLSCCYHLVELQMPTTSQNLRSIILISLKKLQILDLGRTPNLEELSLGNCYSLVELRMPTTSQNLRSIELYGLEKLQILDLRLAPNLEELSLVKCHSFVELWMPTTSQNLRSIELAILEKLQILDLGRTPNLEKLTLFDCHHLTLDLRLAPNLEELNLISCYSLVELWMPTTSQNLRSIELAILEKLQILDLGRTPNLEKLTLVDCHHLTLDLRLAPNLEKLCLESCDDLVELRMPTTSQNLRSIKLNFLKKLQILDLGRTPNLEELSLIQCNSLVELRMMMCYETL